MAPAERTLRGSGPDGDAGSGPVACAVIDTNVWLDLFVFRDPAARRLARALRTGALLAIRSPRTDAELHAVLERPQMAARLLQTSAAQAMQEWQTLARDVETNRAAPWVCRDRDDQKFLDLAFSAPAQVLFTKDRALLRLARSARHDGLQIIAPGDFPGLSECRGTADDASEAGSACGERLP